MTIEQYYATVRRLGLKPTTTPNVYANSAGEFYNVPDASNFTPEQRVETLEVLKRLLGIGFAR